MKILKLKSLLHFITGYFEFWNQVQYKASHLNAKETETEKFWIPHSAMERCAILYSFQNSDEIEKQIPVGGKEWLSSFSGTGRSHAGV